jgi:hypothetical protein
LSSDVVELSVEFGLGEELISLRIIGHVVLSFHLLLELLDPSDLLFGVLYSLEQEVLKVAVWVL